VTLHTERRSARAALVGSVGALATVAVLAACSGGAADTSVRQADGITLRAPNPASAEATELPASEVAAIVALGATNAGPPPEGEHDHHHGGPGTTVPLSASEQVAFDAEIERARSAIAGLDTVEEAAAKGYVLATGPSAGIGTHWVKWSQILEPFDPAMPSMVLFDQTKNPPVLVGYSYALQSPERPIGFTGDGDGWHRHTGICVALNGWVVRERSSGPDACNGSFIAGGDFWMLHAWVVPGWENRDGTFAPMNPKLCPRDDVPDFMRCPEAPQT